MPCLIRSTSYSKCYANTNSKARSKALALYSTNTNTNTNTMYWGTDISNSPLHLLKF